MVIDSTDSSHLWSRLLQLRVIGIATLGCLQSKQGLRGSGVSNERYPASSYRKQSVLCTIYSHRPKSHLAMQVFINISSRGCFYSEELCPSAFTGWLELRGVPFLPRSQFLPGTRSDMPQFDNSAEVRCFTHERPYPCCTTGRTFSSTYFGMGPSIRSKPITALLRDPACPPFCNPLASDLDLSQITEPARYNPS
jgi:hypothetical protein